MLKLEAATRRYGHALFDIAKSEDKVDIFLKELGEVSNILNNSIELKEFLRHPNIPYGDKKKVIKQIFKEKIDTQIIRLVTTLLEHDRVEQIRTVYYDYKYLVYKERGIKIAYVTTAVKMTEEEIEAIGKKLSDKYNKEIEVQNIVDPEVMGGVYLRLGDKVIDGTIRGKLQDMKKMLLAKVGEAHYDNKT
jgi:F-type H+-transporting ATPase subunit delta